MNSLFLLTNYKLITYNCSEIIIHYTNKILLVDELYITVLLIGVHKQLAYNIMFNGVGLFFEVRWFLNSYEKAERLAHDVGLKKNGLNVVKYLFSTSKFRMRSRYN